MLSRRFLIGGLIAIIIYSITQAIFSDDGSMEHVPGIIFMLFLVYYTFGSLVAFSINALLE